MTYAQTSHEWYPRLTFLCPEGRVEDSFRFHNPVDTGRKLNVHKTFRRCPRRLLNVLCAFNLRPVSKDKELIFVTQELPGSLASVFCLNVKATIVML